MLIRRAEEKDLQKVDELLSQVLEVHAAIRPDIFISGTRKYTDEELLEIFKDDERPVFVAEEDGEVLGYAFCIHRDFSGTNNLVPIRSLYIDDLCVDQTARGKHIGSYLCEYVMEYARNNGYYSVTLNVWEGNDSARRFYEKSGFGIQKTLMEKIL